MENKFIDFKDRLSQIVKYIEFADFVNISNISEDSRELYKEKYIGLTHSPIIYNAIIISIYGCYENFVDEILGSYMQLLIDNCNAYSDIPEKILARNKLNSLEYLQSPHRFDSDLYKYNDVLEGLTNTIIQEDKNGLNISLVLKHSSNLHLKELRKLIQAITNKNIVQIIKQSVEFTEYIKNIKGFTTIESTKEYINQKDDEILFQELFILLKARNSVAHGWVVQDRVSLPDIKNKIIPFMSIICKIIYQTLLCEYYNALYKKNKLVKIKGVYEIHHKNVVCLKTKKVSLSYNDIIYVRDGKRTYISKIVNIRYNHDDVTEVKINSDCCIQLEFNLSDSCKFYIYK